MCIYCKLEARHYGINNSLLYYHTTPLDANGAGNVTITMNGDHYAMDFASEDDGVIININYCPICGRKLNKEE